MFSHNMAQLMAGQFSVSLSFSATVANTDGKRLCTILPRNLSLPSKKMIKNKITVKMRLPVTMTTT